jgi:predicted ArsR family transcriptional regulator
VEPARRALYRYVAAQPHAVSREQAAGAVNLPVHSAKFHLDRMVDDGLLAVEYRRLSGRTGPGAGRPSKLYRRSDRQFAVTLPERRYDVAGDVLASAIDRSQRLGIPIGDAVRDAAEAEGRKIAASVAQDGEPAGPPTSRSAGETARTGNLRRVADVLADHGYEPRTADHEVCLANCPFDRLSAEHTALVCGMNLALIGGIIDELGLSDLTAELAPEPGFCCVKVRD